MPRKKKLTACDARKLLAAEGVPFDVDFHTLNSSKVSRIVEVARRAGYRKPKNAPGSTGRMYFQYLARRKSC